MYLLRRATEPFIYFIKARVFNQANEVWAPGDYRYNLGANSSFLTQGIYICISITALSRREPLRGQALRSIIELEYSEKLECPPVLVDISPQMLCWIGPGCLSSFKKDAG